jgi:hypothetical protein
MAETPAAAPLLHSITRSAAKELPQPPLDDSDDDLPLSFFAKAAKAGVAANQLKHHAPSTDVTGGGGVPAAAAETAQESPSAITGSGKASTAVASLSTRGSQGRPAQKKPHSIMQPLNSETLQTLKPAQEPKAQQHHHVPIASKKSPAVDSLSALSIAVHSAKKRARNEQPGEESIQPIPKRSRQAEAGKGGQTDGKDRAKAGRVTSHKPGGGRLGAEVAGVRLSAAGRIPPQTSGIKRGVSRTPAGNYAAPKPNPPSPRVPDERKKPILRTTVAPRAVVHPGSKTQVSASQQFCDSLASESVTLVAAAKPLPTPPTPRKPLPPPAHRLDWASEPPAKPLLHESPLPKQRHTKGPDILPRESGSGPKAATAQPRPEAAAAQPGPPSRSPLGRFAARRSFPSHQPTRVTAEESLLGAGDSSAAAPIVPPPKPRTPSRKAAVATQEGGRRLEVIGPQDPSKPELLQTEEKGTPTPEPPKSQTMREEPTLEAVPTTAAALPPPQRRVLNTPKELKVFGRKRIIPGPPEMSVEVVTPLGLPKNREAAAGKAENTAGVTNVCSHTLKLGADCIVNCGDLVSKSSTECKPNYSNAQYFTH